MPPPRATLAWLSSGPNKETAHAWSPSHHWHGSMTDALQHSSLTGTGSSQIHAYAQHKTTLTTTQGLLFALIAIESRMQPAAICFLNNCNCMHMNISRMNFLAIARLTTSTQCNNHELLQHPRVSDPRYQTKMWRIPASGLPVRPGSDHIRIRSLHATTSKRRRHKSYQCACPHNNQTTTES